MPENLEEGLPILKKKESVDKGSELPVLKKKESTSSQSLLENGTSNSITGASEPTEKLPEINQSINPLGVLTTQENNENQNDPSITVPQGENNLGTAPTYATTKEINALGGTISQTVNSLKSGVASAGAMLARSPAYLSDLTNKTINTIVPLDLSDLPADLAKQHNPIASHLENVAKQLDAEADKDHPLPAVDYFAKGDFSNGFSKLSNSIVKMLPVTAAIVGASAAGVPATGIAVGGTIPFGAAEKQSLLEKNEEDKKAGLPTMSDADIDNVSLVSGALEGATEALFGNVKLGSFYKDLVTKEGVDAANKIVGDGVKQVLAKGLGKYFGTAAEEMAGEGANQYLDNLNHIYIGGDTETKPWDNVMESALVGLGSAGVMGAPVLPHTALQVARTKAQQMEAQKHADNQATLKETLTDKNSPEEVRAAAKDALENSFKQEDELTAKIQKEHADLPDTKKFDVGQHLVKEDMAHKAIQSLMNRSDITAEQKEQQSKVFTDEIEFHQKSVDEIYKENEKIIAERDKEKEKHEEQGLTDYNVKDFAGAHKDIEKEIQDEIAKEKEKQLDEEKKIKEKKQAAKKPKKVETKKTEEVTPEESQHLIVAHAPTETTEKNITSSVSNESLSDKGEVIAEKIGERAKAEGVKTIVTDSETTRNKETAETAAKIADAKVEQVENLHTWDKGEFAGIDSKDWKKSEKYFIDHPDQTEHDGKKLNESFNDFFDRYTKAKRDAKENSDGKTLFVGSSTGIRIEQALESSNGEWTKKAKEHFLNNSIEHEGEIEDNPEADHPAQEQLDRLDKDIEAFKGIKPENIVKKYVAVNYRIDDLVENKLIGKRTANAYKKVFQEIYDQKIKNIKEGVTKVGEDLKKQILGQYKGKMFSSLLPGTPQMIADLIDLGVKITHMYIDANYSTQESIQKAMEKLKKSPLYQKLISAGVINSKQFEIELTNNFSKAKPEDENLEKYFGTSDEAKKEINGGEKQRQSLKKLVESGKYNDISKRLKEEQKNYKTLNQKNVVAYVNLLIDEYERESMLVRLADDIMAGKTDVPYEIQRLLARKLTTRLNILANQQTNEFTKQTTYDKAAELAVWRAELSTSAAQLLGIDNEQEKLLPSDKEGLRVFANKELEKLHDKILSKEEKSQIEQVTKEVNSLLDEDNLTPEQTALLNRLVSKKIDEIYSDINGKDHIEKVNKLQSLIMDLTDC